MVESTPPLLSYCMIFAQVISCHKYEPNNYYEIRQKHFYLLLKLILYCCYAQYNTKFWKCQGVFASLNFCTTVCIYIFPLSSISLVTYSVKYSCVIPFFLAYIATRYSHLLRVRIEHPDKYNFHDKIFRCRITYRLPQQ